MEKKDNNLAADKHTSPKGRINEGALSSIDYYDCKEECDQTLLNALQDLIIRVTNPKQKNDINQTHLGQEAAKLITALHEFISSIVVHSQSSARNIIEVSLEKEEDEPQRDNHVDTGKGSLLPKTGIAKPSGGASRDNYSGNQVPLEKPIPPFEEKLLRTLREHVFNSMPVRLLFFEQHKSSLQISLFERGAIFSRLASTLQRKMYEEEFRPQIGEQTHKMETDLEVIERLISKYTKYAILSHTWLRTASGSEVTYADWNKEGLDVNNPGYRKLVNFCKTAWKDHGLAFGWMDTVCINKESSSELDESIRSMYNWYSRAGTCIIYLAKTATLSDMPSDPWFTRGWTFQELLAPPVIKFYNGHWQRLIDSSDNDKQDREITEKITQATCISKEELVAIHNSRISRRMQLAANREVTREEDTAYSLMGIFGVSISTAYGEGAQRAFFRLLQEILFSGKDVFDILNWAGTTPASQPHTSFILPSSPKNYINCSSENRLILYRWPIEPLTLSHRGLRIPVILMPGISIQDTAPRHDPFGDYYGTINISPIEYFHNIPTTYNLLDSKASGQDGWNKDNDWFQMTFAVFNFDRVSDSDIIRLPKTCIAMGLQCEEPVGEISSMGGSEYIRTHEPIVFDLCKMPTIDENHQLHDKPSNYSEWYWFTKRDELANHGMQLITLYL